MNVSGFIARRIIGNENRHQFSRPIVQIATIGIAVGIALMIMSVAIVKGFQHEIREKVIGFGSHFQVVSNNDNYTKDSQRLLFEQSVYDTLKNINGVNHVQVFATRPGIMETADALQGIAIKGIGKDYDWNFFDSKLIEGRKLKVDTSEKQLEVIVSKYLAGRMLLKLNDKVSIYFINSDSDARQRNFTVVGIYETGLEEYDNQFVFVDIAHIQKLSGWGLEVQLLIDTLCSDGVIAMGAAAFGGDGNYHYKWNAEELEGEGPFFIYTTQDTTLSVILKDESNTSPDTAYCTIDFLDDASSEPCRPYQLINITSGGSQDNYIGGYEVLINDFAQLEKMDEKIFNSLPYQLTTQKITDRSADIFSWLGMLDLNVIVIIVLMVVISIVNMTSALLILILERQNMIGTLKAFGSRNGLVIRIFLLNAAWIIGRGLLWGNVIGIGLVFLQSKFGLVKLDQANYFVNEVPVLFDLSYILLLDIGSLLACLLFLLAPAFYITRISPIQAIRFN